MSATPDYIFATLYSQISAAVSQMQSMQSQLGRTEEAVWSIREHAAAIDRNHGERILDLRREIHGLRVEIARVEEKIGGRKSSLIMTIASALVTHWQPILLVSMSLLGVLGLVSPETVKRMASIGK